MDKLPPCVCPHASYVSTEPSDPKIKCGVMEADQARADRILEGAPVGVIISARTDASTFFAWCTGDGEPTTDPDKPAMHHSACPIFAAEKEWKEVERLFGEVKDAPDLASLIDQAGVQLRDEQLTPGEVEWLTAAEV